MLEFARIESHFFHNRGWMEDGQLLKPENVARIAHIPTVVVQGRYDVVCPAKSAWDLRESWLKCPGGEKTLEVSRGASCCTSLDVLLTLNIHAHTPSVLHDPRRGSLCPRARNHGQAHVCH